MEKIIGLLAAMLLLFGCDEKGNEGGRPLEKTKEIRQQLTEESDPQETSKEEQISPPTDLKKGLNLRYVCTNIPGEVHHGIWNLGRGKFEIQRENVMGICSTCHLNLPKLVNIEILDSSYSYDLLILLENGKVPEPFDPEKIRTHYLAVEKKGGQERKGNNPSYFQEKGWSEKFRAISYMNINVY